MPEGVQRGPSEADTWEWMRGMWQRADPAPTGLVDSVIAAIAAEDLDAELLSLRPAELAGVRGEGAQVLEFTSDSLTLVLRLGQDDDGSRRVDGWAEGIREVALVNEEWSRTVQVSAAGRFEFDKVPSGPVRLRLRSDEGAYLTPGFEV
ncbi:hypothetical protein [Ruania alba]|uniref:Uncharacterized protein n=1 Tax=Ruania alba TaxID=648782 RepID=A0A1H5HAN4_9MICO|nr:hypothetical protein [Ruania alba]SEE24804.1 hypothetical protein SAMN04488554_1901 [Ruania alba]